MRNSFSYGRIQSPQYNSTLGTAGYLHILKYRDTENLVAYMLFAHASVHLKFNGFRIIQLPLLRLMTK